MTRMDEDARSRIYAAIGPSRNEVIAAKRRVLEVMWDRRPHHIGNLIDLLVEDEHVPTPQHGDRIDLDAFDDSHPILRYVRLQTAVVEAISELDAQGFFVPVHSGEHANIGQLLNIPWHRQGTSSGIDMSEGVPVLRHQHIRLVHGLNPSYFPRIYDHDLYLEALKDLEFDDRPRRCLYEALRSYRQGLYISCGSLLGAAGEAAWFSIGEAFRAESKTWADLLDRGSFTDLQKKLLPKMRPLFPDTLIDELVSFASLLRRMRNYGVHPKGVDDAAVERYFNDETCGVLLVENHDYLVRLAKLKVDLKEKTTHP